MSRVGVILRTLSGVVSMTLLAVSAAWGATPASAGEQLAQFHRDWVAAGKPSAESAASPQFGTEALEYASVHAYAFQANTASDLIMDDGNGYRYFGAPAVPYMAAPVRLPSGSMLTAITLSACTVNDGDLVVGLYDNGVGGSGSAGGTLIAGPVTSVHGCEIVFQMLPTYLYARNLDHRCISSSISPAADGREPRSSTASRSRTSARFHRHRRARHSPTCLRQTSDSSTSKRSPPPASPADAATENTAPTPPSTAARWPSSWRRHSACTGTKSTPLTLTLSSRWGERELSWRDTAAGWSSPGSLATLGMTAIRGTGLVRGVNSLPSGAGEEVHAAGADPWERVR